MPRLEETILVARPIEDCFRYVADFSTIEQWDPGVYRSEKITAGPVKVGSRFEVIINSGGRHQKMVYSLKEYDPPHRVVLIGQGDGFTADDRIEFKARDEGTTEIHYVADLEFSGLLGAVTPLFRPWLDRVGRKAVQGLKEALEPAEEIASPGPIDMIKRLTVLPAAWDFTERGYLKMENKGLSEFIDGHTVVITGPTSGLGLATACELHRLGARLILLGRSPDRLDAAVQQIVAFSGRSERIELVEADLSLISQVRRAAREILDRTEKVDALINNAGALFQERGETPEGFERSLAINLLSPFVLTESLRAGGAFARGARVINVSSGGMYTQPLVLEDMNYRDESYDGAKAYARAKRGLVAVTDYWAEQQDLKTATFNSMHPGWAATPGVEHSLPLFYKTMKGNLRDTRMGADTIIWLATATAAGEATGQFFFDRKPRPTSIFPGTEVTPEKRGELIKWLHKTTDQLA